MGIIIIIPSWKNEKSMRLYRLAVKKSRPWQSSGSCAVACTGEQNCSGHGLGGLACLGSRSAPPLSCSETFTSPGYFTSLFLHFLSCKMKIIIGSLGSGREWGEGGGRFKYMVLSGVVLRIKAANICNKL